MSNIQRATVVSGCSYSVQAALLDLCLKTKELSPSSLNLILTAE
nr:hypothetical protein [uncultured Parasutterella sp.]